MAQIYNINSQKDVRFCFRVNVANSKISCNSILFQRITYLLIKKTMNNTKDVMLTLRIDKNQYLRLLEALVRERKSKSTFIRESIQKSIENGYPKNCRKNEIEEWINGL
jgi:hypothetical protein